ncbi:MAG: threonine/serine exporter family protein [Fusobacterium sp.]|nr:threonine/serine exporter family protein [Fusobacterium sp.]
MRDNLQVTRIISTANLLGKVFLMSGAEVYRVENAVAIVCRRFGLKGESFVTQACVLTSARKRNGEIITEINRVYSISNNLDKIDKINKIILDIDKYDLDSLEKAIKKIQTESIYTDNVLMISYFFAAAFFAILFKGGFFDFLVAGFGGVIIFYINKIASLLKINNFFINTLNGFLITILAVLSTKLNIIYTPSHSVIGALMLLVPGLALTNAIRDLINGDLIAGTSRTVESFLIGAALAIGAGFGLFVIS